MTVNEMNLSLTRTSRYIAYVLRHNPAAAGITLDEHGWADVEHLLIGVNKKRRLSIEDLRRIVAEDDKQRYTFDETGKYIRANQGHSIQVDVELEEKEPPEYLWHGTAERFAESIEREGILPQTRLYVHLSADLETAIKVGRRHGKPMIYRVAAGKMLQDGCCFFCSKNGVWLTERVSAVYIEKWM